MVFYNSKYADVFEALNYADGLAALGTLIKVSSTQSLIIRGVVSSLTCLLIKGTRE